MASSGTQDPASIAAEPTHASVTAIVATLAEASRRDSLLRAIDSLRRAATRAHLTIVVVVNGDRHAPEVLAAVRASGVRLLQIAQGSLPAALLEGRRHVEGDYFCFLDDDDEYLEGAIDRRVAVLAREPACALVASNGYRRTGATDSVALQQLANVPADPLSALFRENWLPSCGGLFRTADVGVELFEDVQPYMEWTWLAFLIARSGRRVVVLDEPTFRIHDTAASLSKTPQYLASSVALHARMLQHGLPAHLRTTVRRRLATALSRRSVALLAQGDLPGAWRCHLQTLTHPGGWRYAAQAVRLTSASLRSVFARRGTSQ